jgi:Uracil DNA glycosylase superfamily.
MSLEAITREFCLATEELFPFKEEMISVNVFSYAIDPFLEYLEKAERGSVRTLYLGMNPGPYGMYRTGIPFCDFVTKREFLKITASVDETFIDVDAVRGEKPDEKRREVSGMRLWGLFESVYHSPERFFSSSLVLSYSPLIFFRSEGRRANIALSDVKSLDRKRIEKVSDEFLKRYIKELKCDTLVGIGDYAHRALVRCSDGERLLKIAHPSPANPAANGDWAGRTYCYLKSEGVME